MILVDPDLDSDTGPHASASKRASSTDPPPVDRRLRVPSARVLARFLRQAQAQVRLRGEVSVLLAAEGKIRRLNRQFRGKDKATDVLSFPAPDAMAGEVAGDLAISVPTALRQAREQGHTLAVEIKVLILHGLLHLAGHDHERDDGEMARRERRLRGRLGLPQGLIERSFDPTLATESSREDGARGGSLRRRSAGNASPDDKSRKKRVLRSTQDDTLRSVPRQRRKS